MEKLESDVKKFMEPRAVVSCLNAMEVCDATAFERRVKYLQELKSDYSELKAILHPLELAVYKNRIDIATFYYNKGTEPCSEMLCLTLKQPCIWSNFRVGKMYFEVAMENKMEAIALHSMANATYKHCALILHLCNVFCSCNNKETTRHEKHVKIINTRLNILFEESNFGETLVEKYLLNGNFQIAETLLRKGAVKPPVDMLLKISRTNGKFI